MYDVRISDNLYRLASEAAKASHVTLDRYVEEALQLQLKVDAPIQLTAEQSAIITNAESEIDAGNFLTAEQVREHFKTKNSAASPGIHP